MVRIQNVPGVRFKSGTSRIRELEYLARLVWQAEAVIPHLLASNSGVWGKCLWRILARGPILGYGVVRVGPVHASIGQI
jgi:hypothetical protein